MKKMFLIKLISAFLATLMIIPLLSSCKDTHEESKETEETKQPIESEIESESEKDSESESNNENITITYPINIIVDGSSDYVIVRGENASPSELTAASELQAYLNKMGGFELPIVTDSTPAVENEIVVGKTNRETDGEFDRTELGDDGFIIKTKGQTIFLVGGETRGTLYSVYTFLEEYLGCRFYTSTIEKIPELKTVGIEKISEDKQIPVFKFRDIDWLCSRQGTFQAKSKINGRYVILGDNFGGHYTYAAFCHTMNALVDPNVYFAEHPEYFTSKLNGVVIPEGANPQHYFQPCLTNPEVLKIAIENVRKWLISSPNANIVSISQNDNGNYCECEECNKVFEEEGAQSGVLLRFVNAIATELGDEFPNVLFDTLAYQYTRTAPKITVPASNVIVRLCTIECCFSHPLGTCDDVDESINKSSIADDIEAWSKITNRIYVWDYVTNYAYTSSLFPNFNSMLANAKFFADHSVEGIYAEGNYFDELSDFPELRAYILGKILWDPYMSEEEYWEHIDDFLEGCYGPGWTYIREFINIAQDSVKNVCFGIFDYPYVMYKANSTINHNILAIPENLTADMIRNYENTDWSQFLDFYVDLEIPKIVFEGENLFDAAYKMATTDEQKYMIDKTSICADYIKSIYLGEKISINAEGNAILNMIYRYITVHSNEFSSEELSNLRIYASRYAASQAITKVKNELAEFNKSLIDKLLSYGIERIAEHYTIYPDYTWRNTNGTTGDINLDEGPNNWTK